MTVLEKVPHPPLLPEAHWPVVLCLLESQCPSATPSSWHQGVQLASLMWDTRVRGMMLGADIGPYGGGFHLTQCNFNPAYYQLDPTMYPEKFGLIGEGAQGSVIYVQYRDAQGKWTPAAVKFMDPVHKASVKREVKCLKASQHSNHIPALLSADRAKCDGVHSRFIAMRFVEKVDMDAYFDGLRNLETEASLNIFLNDVTRTSSHIVQGIADMHDADWAHLDLKPANLCMEISNGQTQTFLVDFGSSMHGLNTEPEAKLWSTEAIAAPIEEYQTHGITSMAEFLVYYLKKQAHGAAKLQLGTSIANSSLTQFAEDVRRLQHPKLHKLYSIAAYLLHTDRDDRSTVLEAACSTAAVKASAATGSSEEGLAAEELASKLALAKLHYEERVTSKSGGTKGSLRTRDRSDTLLPPPD
ncbi:hypothetical protein WJX82_005556 [Trebouxia sp. C0006]